MTELSCYIWSVFGTVFALDSKVDGIESSWLATAYLMFPYRPKELDKLYMS